MATRDGTDKVLTARKLRGCAVVKRSWLMQCYWSLTRRDPKPHLLVATGREVASRRREGTSLSPVRDIIAAAKPKEAPQEEDSDDEDDDALADEFEKDFM